METMHDDEDNEDDGLGRNDCAPEVKMKHSVSSATTLTSY
jgi:hypothetical protein